MLYRFGDFELDPDRFQLRRGGEPVPVTRQVFELIHLLVRHRDRPVTRDELLAKVWSGRAVGSTSLSRTISEARKVLGDLRRHQRIIRTVHGRGYWFVADVTEEGVELAPQPDLAPASRWPFVGRERELEVVGDLLLGAQQGSGGLVLLTGEAGIGKTRMAQEAGRRAAERGFLVALGSCREAADAAPLWPWIAVLRALDRAFDLRRALGDVGRAFDGIVDAVAELDPNPERAPREPPEDAKAARLHFFDDVSTVLLGCAGERPLLLVLDDLHGADRLSLQLLQFVARDLPSGPILVVGTRRELEPRDNPRLPELDLLARTEGVTTLGLPRFSEADAGALIDRCGVEVPKGQARAALYEHSGGNPFFLVQLLSLPDLGGRIERADASHPSSWLPRTVRDSVHAQVDGLPATCRDLLGMAAVCGRSFSPLVLGACTERIAEDVLMELQPAIRTGVLESVEGEGELRFAHVLLRDVLYGALPASGRARLHMQAAGALRGLLGPDPGPHSAELAHHVRSAWPLGDLDTAVRDTVHAARWATEHLAFDEAATHCRNALELLESSPVADDQSTFDVLLALAAAQLRAGLRADGRDTLRKVYRLADRLGARDRLADVALTIAPGFFSIETGVVDQLLITTLEEALEAIGPTPSPTRVRLLCQLALALYWIDPGPRRRALIDEAAAAATALDDPASLAHTNLARFAALWSPDNFDQRMAMLDSLPSSPTRDGVHVLMGRFFRVATLLEAGLVHRIDYEIDSFAQLLELVPDPHARWYLPMMGAMRALTTGDFAQAEGCVSEYLAMGGRFGDANTAHSLAAHACEVMWQTGRSREAIAPASRLADRYPTVPEWQAILAFLYVESNQLDEARKLVPRLRALCADQAARRINWAIAVCALAEVAFQLGDRNLASEIYDLLLPYRGRFIVAGYGVACWGPVSRFIGQLAVVLERWEEAEALLTSALDQSSAAGLSPWVAHSQVALSRLYLCRNQSGDDARAESCAIAARGLADELGMHGVTARIDRLGTTR